MFAGARASQQRRKRNGPIDRALGRRQAAFYPVHFLGRARLAQRFASRFKPVVGRISSAALVLGAVPVPLLTASLTAPHGR
jgi:hypothetical protein